MPDQLHQVSPAPPEDPQIAGMRVAFEPLLHDQRQRAEPLAHVGVPGRKPNPRPARKRDHRQRSRAVSAPITFASVAASGAPSIVTRTCSPKAIVIEHDGVGGGGAHIGAVVGAASFSSGKTRTGTNVVVPRSAANCRRQQYRRLATTPAPRAISVTAAPGSFIAATSRAFSAVLQRRRRSTDVMTSIRSITMWLTSC